MVAAAVKQRLLRSLPSPGLSTAPKEPSANPRLLENSKGHTSLAGQTVFIWYKLLWGHGSLRWTPNKNPPQRGNMPPAWDEAPSWSLHEVLMEQGRDERWEFRRWEKGGRKKSAWTCFCCVPSSLVLEPNAHLVVSTSSLMYCPTEQGVGDLLLNRVLWWDMPTGEIYRYLPSKMTSSRADKVL